MIGKVIGHYRIVEKLGEGGMGVVYKACDTHLDRFVAIKLLPPAKVADATRKARFAQEAKAASALNHPNIVTIHDISSENGIDFIAMEYVAGKTLDELISRKGMRLSEALKTGVQIAGALARAHAAGIVHRDLKPANIMVDEHGQVKVLDFGLAKLTETAPFGEDDSTRTLAPRTEEGTIVGTIAYMSPEQAAGKPLDARSDIFSFGSLLYEMVTGRRAFEQDTKMSTLAAIIGGEPSPLGGSVPYDLERIIARCLRKDPERRSQLMRDVGVSLEELIEESGAGKAIAPEASPRRNRSRLIWIGALLAVAAGAAAILASVLIGGTAPALSPVALTSYAGSEREPAFSPDGAQVAFVWDGEKQDNRDIYVTLIGSGRPLRLTTDPADDFSPAWSPDGRSIAFVRSRPGGTASVLLISPLGGPERKLGEVCAPALFMSGPYLAWSPDSASLAVIDRASSAEPISLFLLSVESGEKRRLTFPPALTSGDTGPAFSPDGRSLAFCRMVTAVGTDLYLLSLTTGFTPAGEPKRLAIRGWNIASPAWIEQRSWNPFGVGRDIVFSSTWAREGLWRVAATGVGTPERLPFAGADASYSAISPRSHRLVYTRSLSDVNIWRIGAAGGPTAPVIASTQYDGFPHFSPDGTRVTFQSNRSGVLEIWVAGSDGSDPMQLTSMGAAATGGPRWSPDGGSITFDSNLDGQHQVYVIGANGGKPRRLTSQPGDAGLASWSHDGHWIYFNSNRSGEEQIWKMPATGGDPVPVTRKGGSNPLESPDGKWIYYGRYGTNAGAGLWKARADGSEETKVLESMVDARTYAITGEGIYFLTDADSEATGAPDSSVSLRFLNSATGKTTEIAAVGRAPAGLAGLTVSPDGRWILYPRLDQRGSDLMLVENFR